MGRVWENPIDPDVPGFSGGWFAIWHLPDSVYAGAFAAKYGGPAGQPSDRGGTPTFCGRSAAAAIGRHLVKRLEPLGYEVTLAERSAV